MNEVTASPRTEQAIAQRGIPGENNGSNTPFEDFWQDVQYGLRVLRKKPAFTLVAVLTLALGIGANTAIFSIVNASLLTPIAIPQPERVVLVWTELAQGSKQLPASIPDFLDWKTSGAFETLSGYSSDGFNLLIDKRPERLQGLSVTGDFFKTIQARAALGRLFRADDMQPGHNHVAVLASDLWYSQFGQDPHVIGKSVFVNSAPYTIIGVLPRGVPKLASEELYVPLVFEPPLSTDRGLRAMVALGRLSPDVSFAGAQNRMLTLAMRLGRDYPNEDGGARIRLEPIEQVYIEDINALIWVLFGAVGFVLLVACANIANLLLVRGTARRKEIAIRAAMGAGRFRLFRQLITESVVLSILGGLVGMIPAFFGLRVLVKFRPDALPNANLIGLNPSVLLFTLGIAVFTGLLFGAIPALQAWKANVNSPLRERSQASGRELRFGNFFVVAEVALTVVLVAGAALMLRSFMALRSSYPGYEDRNVLTMRLSLSGKQYESAQKQILFYRELIRRLNELPGVRRAAATDSLPTSDDVYGGTLHFADRPEPKKSDAAVVVVNSVTPEFFDAMHIPVLGGRAFSDRDGPGDPLTVIIDAGTAKRYWPNRDPIGQSIRLRLGTPLRKIVGICGMIERSIASKVKARIGEAYVPLAQAPNPMNLPNPEMSLVISGETNARSLIGPVRRVIASLAPDQPVFQVQTMEEARAAGRVASRFGTWLLGSFAVLSLLLAGVGIYGVVSYSVEQRTREIGVRMAVGATPGNIVASSLGKGLRLTTTGLVIGLIGAFFLTRTMGSLLHGVSAIDPVSFLLSAFLLVAAGLLATYVPARRASKVDPMVALRHE